MTDSGDGDRSTPGDRWTQCVRRRDFARAWEISDAVLRDRADRPCWHLPRHEQYIWNGTPLDGARVLVHCYHRLGDTIQFVCFAPLIQAVAASVICPRLSYDAADRAGALELDRLLPPAAMPRRCVLANW